MLRTRVWTALIALPLLLAAILFAPVALFTAFIVLLGLLGLYEIATMTKADSFGRLAVLAILGIGPAVAVFLNPGTMWWLPMLVFAACAALMGTVATRGGSSGPHGMALTGLGAIWVGALFPYFALLRNAAGGVALTILMLLVVVASDSGAYFAGIGLGRNRLAPRLSPNKTVEGAVGGLVSCIMVGLLLRPLLASGLSLAQMALAAAAIGVLAQLGDLIGSAIKRTAGVKDSGVIFPGHGGLLDRTCSLVFGAAFTYYWIR